MNRCQVCAKTFSCSRSFQTHLKSKSHKVRSEKTIDLFTCICGRKFNQLSGLSRHKKQCNYDEPPKNIIQTLQERRHEKDQATQEMRDEITQLKDQIKALASNNTTQSTSNIQNTTTTNHTNSHNKVTININPFGQENIDMISPEYFLHCLNRIYNSSLALAEKIYSYPENQNIRIPNKNKPYVSVQLENGKSKLQLLETVLDEIENFCYTLLEEKFTDPDYRKQMSQMKQQAFENYMEAYENDDKGTVRKNIRSTLKLMLLNMTEEAKQ